MITLARQQVVAIPGAAARTRFILADARIDPLPANGYDLVVTNFFLDCFRPAELAAVVRRVAMKCAPEALWVDGDFRVPHSGAARLTARFLLAGLYGFFGVAARLSARRLTDPAPLLVAEGFTQIGEISYLRGLLSGRLWVRGSFAPTF